MERGNRKGGAPVERVYHDSLDITNCLTGEIS